jgi:hypothetical protein
MTQNSRNAWAEISAELDSKTQNHDRETPPPDVHQPDAFDDSKKRICQETGRFGIFSPAEASSWHWLTVNGCFVW